MEKPRIIIADTDADYILPLQMKFAEDYFEKVDLEIITDEAYFRELFSVPQSADILILSESLYDRTIQRHNITNVFLMTEQYQGDHTTDLSVTRIFKYTSVKEIFSEITGKGAATLVDSSSVKQDPRIVLVYSAAGGVGKTTVAMGISAALTKNYKRVLYMNAARMQSFQHMLENQTPITESEIYAKLTMPNGNIYSALKHTVRKELFSYIPPFKAAIMALGLQYSVYRQIAESAKNSREYDYIVIDCDVAFDEEKARLMSMADKVVIVTNQTIASVCATNILASNINGVNEEKYVFVCNDLDKDKDNALIAPSIDLKFSISDYIDHFPLYEQMSISDFSNQNCIQKTEYLIS